MNRLVLWDIDRTLVNIGGVSQTIYADAFKAVTGRVLQQMPDMAGQTDHDLVRSTLTLHDIVPSDGLVQRYYDALAVAAQTRQSEIRAGGAALPGAAEALLALTEHPGVVQSVVTGNLRPIGRLKLTLFALDAHIDFDVGGYGSDDGVRSTLVRLARERAERKYGRAFAADHAVVVGDTPHDIAGARDSGARAVGVASGGSSADQLAAAGADVVLNSLLDTAAVVRAVLGMAPTESG